MTQLEGTLLITPNQCKKEVIIDPVLYDPAVSKSVYKLFAVLFLSGHLSRQLF